MTLRAPAFEVLEHTADTGIRVFGSTLPELFANAALAVEAIALDIDAVEPRIAYPLSAHAEDRPSLLVNWLNEIIYCLDGLRVALARFDVETCTDTAISGRGWGEPRDPLRHRARLVVKAATWHQLSLRQQDDRWVAEVYLDI
jgi:SHS2 domain-containing protein